MKLTFSPHRNDTHLDLERQGDRLILNGDTLDLSAIPEGATLPQGAVNSLWIAGAITRRDGVLYVPLRLPHGPRAPRQTLFPAPLTLTGDGPVALPPHEETAHV